MVTKRLVALLIEHTRPTKHPEAEVQLNGQICWQKRVALMPHAASRRKGLPLSLGKDPQLCLATVPV